MKKAIVWALICALLLNMCPALAEEMTPEKALNVISNHLTEVYSYTAEEAAQFHVRAEWETDHWRIWFSPADHPEWEYTATYQEGDPHIENAVTPFWHNVKPRNYPGEGSVRDGLRRAREKGWFVIWEDHMRQELAEYIANFEIVPTARLANGLATGGISAGDALHEFFVSCYGDELDWAPALKQWYNEEMSFYGFTVSQEEEPVEPGIVVQKATAYNDVEVELTRFIDEVPAWLQPLFDRPELEGWHCLCGAAAQNVLNRYGYGLAAFEKDGQRLLVGLKYDMDTGEWKLSPISDKALYTDRDMHILYCDAMNKNRFTIVYQNTPTETERFEVTVGGTEAETDAYIRSYLRMDEATGSGLKLEMDIGVKASVYENHQKMKEEQGEKNFSTAMSMLDINAFPTSVEAWKALEQQVIPQGYALVRGVHLRQKTSSRSKDLGQYNGGVLAKVLGTEPGDPWPWYRVQIGRAEGYMASHYVDEAVTQDTGYTLDRGLPLARTQKELKLKKKPAWYAGNVQTIPEGTLMHVLADCDGGWLHVSIPQGEIGWQMDVNGTDGYIRQDDVQLGANPLAMEWSI